jgi:Rad3-related DNA helicase
LLRESFAGRTAVTGFRRRLHNEHRGGRRRRQRHRQTRRLATHAVADSLRKLAEGNDAQPAQRTIFYLNQWLSSDPAAKTPWEADQLIRSLPRSLREVPTADPEKPENQQWVKDLAKLQFHGDDMDEIQYLQQNLWLQDIDQHARREPISPRLRPWLKEIESSVGCPKQNSWRWPSGCSTDDAEYPT